LAEQVYGPERPERLVRLLRELAARIRALDDDALLAAGPQLLKLMGDVRSELFHYEVRCTYDTPEVAEHRRIVEQARQAEGLMNQDENEDEEPWRDR
jgi:hypothetical protein